jgi:DNA-binding NarL/FixJ family response regulator
LIGGMNPIPNPIRHALILREDRVYAGALGTTILRVFPQAQISLATTVEATAKLLAAGSIDLLVTGLGHGIEGDVLELLLWWVNQRPNSHRVLVVTSDRQYRMLDALRRLGISGVFDSSHDHPERLAAALEQVGSGARYWSSTLLEFMLHARKNSTPLSSLLTAGEQVVLSVVGDGSDDVSAANQLGISPATVSTVRRDLHRKLGVQHRGELIRVAAQHGFVQFTPKGVVRPGFALFSAEYYARRARRSSSGSGSSA